MSVAGQGSCPRRMNFLWERQELEGLSEAVGTVNSGWVENGSSMMHVAAVQGR